MLGVSVEDSYATVGAARNAREDMLGHGRQKQLLHQEYHQEHLRVQGLEFRVWGLSLGFEV